MTPRPPVHELEQRLRAEARLARRPAPPGLLDRALGAAGPVPALTRAGDSRIAAGTAGSRSRLRTLLGLAAAVLVVAALRLALPDLSGEDEPASPARFAALREAGALLAEPRLSAGVEHPLLQELELLGQDTARAAVALVRDLPGPLGDMFAPR